MALHRARSPHTSVNQSQVQLSNAEFVETSLNVWLETVIYQGPVSVCIRPLAVYSMGDESSYKSKFSPMGKKLTFEKTHIWVFMAAGHKHYWFFYWQGTKASVWTCCPQKILWMALWFCPRIILNIWKDLELFVFRKAEYMHAEHIFIVSPNPSAAFHN